MSVAGHVFDMINRLKNNRQLRQEQHLKYAKVKEAYQKISLHYPEFHDRKKLSPPEIKKLKRKIRLEILRNRNRNRILASAFLITLMVLVAYIFYTSLFI